MKTRHSKWSVSRRALLRGTLGSASVLLGLPLLEAMLNGNGNALADGTPLPKRFGVWFWGNGTDPGRWAPATEGAGWQPSQMLGGLAAVKDYVNVVSGTLLETRWHQGSAQKHNPHVEGAAGILTGGNPVVHSSYAGQEDDWNFLNVPAASIEQVAADHLSAPNTPFRSITLAITPVHTSDAGSSNHPGTAISYISHSARSGSTPVFNPPRFSPSEVFGYLFSGGVGGEGGGSAEPMLTPEEISRAAMRSRLGKNDRDRLAQHLDGVHELQARIKNLPPPPPSAACEVPANPGDPTSDRMRVKAMADLIAMAFACDLTRTFSLCFSSPASHVDYPDVYPDSLVFNGEAQSFHNYEHLAGIDDTVRVGLQYFVDCFGDLAASLKAMPEQDGNVLDNSCILGTTDVASGPSHGFTDFPVLVAGRAGGKLKYPGVHVKLPGQKACRIPLTCLQAVGVPITSFGQDQFFTDQAIAQILA